MYVDDIVLLAKNRVALLDMDTLRRFLKSRKLELCAEKTKTVFNKCGKKKKELWKWERKKWQLERYGV